MYFKETLYSRKKYGLHCHFRIFVNWKPLGSTVKNLTILDTLSVQKKLITFSEFCIKFCEIYVALKVGMNDIHGLMLATTSSLVLYTRSKFSIFFESASKAVDKCLPNQHTIPYFKNQETVPFPPHRLRTFQ